MCVRCTFVRDTCACDAYLCCECVRTLRHWSPKATNLVTYVHLRCRSAQRMRAYAARVWNVHTCVLQKCASYARVCCKSALIVHSLVLLRLVLHKQANTEGVCLFVQHKSEQHWGLTTHALALHMCAYIAHLRSVRVCTLRILAACAHLRCTLCGVHARMLRVTYEHARVARILVRKLQRTCVYAAEVAAYVYVRCEYSQHTRTVRARTLRELRQNKFCLVLAAYAHSQCAYAAKVIKD